MNALDFWRKLRDFLTGRRLERAKERHARAADQLDAAVKELLKK